MSDEALDLTTLFMAIAVLILNLILLRIVTNREKELVALEKQIERAERKGKENGCQSRDK